MFNKIFSAVYKLALAASVCLAVFAAQSAVSAQERGGSLGSSAGVFRPGNPKPAAKTPTKTAKTTPTRTAPKAKSTAVKTKTPAKNKQKVVNISRSRQPKTTNPKQPKNSGNVAEQVELAIAEGNEARDARNYIAAQTAYEQAQELNPQDARAFYGLGNIFTDQQRWQEAEEMYRQALKIDPRQPEANIALSYVLLQPSRGGNLPANFEEAEAAARRAIALDSKNPMAYDQLGVSFESRGVISAETENAYRRSIEIDKNFALGYAHLGRLLRKRGKTEDSQKYYKQAAALAEDVGTIILVAEVLQSENKFDDSEKLLQKAAKLDDKNPTVAFLQGQIQIRRGNFAVAETFLNKSIGISPYSFVAHYALGAVYLRQAKYEEAERVYTQALQIAAGGERHQLAGVYGFTGVGDGYMKRGDKADALRVYRQALELDAKNNDLNAKITAAARGENR